jgi:hypothetical protein
MSIVMDQVDYSSVAGVKSGFKGGDDGYISRVVPKGWKYQKFPNLKKRNKIDLANLLSSPSAKTQLHAQQEILRRRGMSKEVLAVAMDTKQATKSRIAAIYTVKATAWRSFTSQLLELAKDPAVAEHALRALADRKTQLKGCTCGSIYLMPLEIKSLAYR